MLETEFNSIPESLREQTESLTREILSWLEQTLADGRAQDVFYFKGEPGDKAVLILTSLQGALQ